MLLSMQHNLFVSTEWLDQNLGQVKVVEGGIEPQSHAKRRIPDSVFWDLSPEMNFQPLQPEALHRQFEQLLRDGGIEATDTIVFTGEMPPMGGLLAWRALLFGLNRIHVLDGGSEKWHREARPHQSGAPVAVAASEIVLPAPDLAGWATTSDVERVREDGATCLLDVRTEAEWSGQLFMLEPPVNGQIAGHINGAVLVPYDIAFHADGTLCSDHDLRAIYAQHGVTGDRDIIVYCTVGGRSAFTSLVLQRVCGFARVRNYVGSWNEWSQREMP